MTEIKGRLVVHAGCRERLRAKDFSPLRIEGDKSYSGE